MDTTGGQQIDPADGRPRIPPSGGVDVVPRREAPTVAPPGGPTAAGHLTIERRGIEPVPEGARYGRPARAFTVWFAPQITPVPFFVGTLVPSIGLGWWEGLTAIVVGTVVGAAAVSWLALMGPQTGTAQLALSRLPFGRSIAVPAVVNWLSTIGWEAFVNIFGATALTLLTGLPFWSSVLLILGGQLALGILGFEVIHIFERWMTWVLGITFVIITIKVISLAQVTSHATVAGADLVGSFVLMSAISAGYVLGWATYAADYTRYLPSRTPRRPLFTFTFLGIVIGTVWMELLGFTVASRLSGGSPMASLRDLVGGGALGALAMAAAYLSTVAVNALNDYTGGLSLQASGVRIPRPLAAAVGAVLAMILTLYLDLGNVAGNAENLLLLITYWVGPWLAVVAIDWGRRRGGVDVSDLMDLRALGRGLAALTALVAGFIACMPFSNTSIGATLAASNSPWAAWLGSVSRTMLHGADLAYIVGFVVAGAVYWALSDPRRLGRSTASAAIAPEST